MVPAYRPVGPADLDECSRCLRDGFLYDAADRRALVALWRRLLADGYLHGGLIRDLSWPDGQQVFWVCFKAFVPEDFACFLKTQGRPYVGRELLRAWSSGACDQFPLLGRKELGHANLSEGVTMLVPWSGYSKAWVAKNGLEAVGTILLDFDRYFTNGYRLNEIVEEFYDDFEKQWGIGAGFTPCRDYADQVEALQEFPVHPPLLMHCTRPMAARQVGTNCTAMFEYRCPQLFFTQAEQELLMHSLLHETEDEAAEALSLAVITVKKRWQGIYERIERSDGELARLLAANGNGAAGRSRRRHVLNYVRHHIEELRVLPPPITAARLSASPESRAYERAADRSHWGRVIKG